MFKTAQKYGSIHWQHGKNTIAEWGTVFYSLEIFYKCLSHHYGFGYHCYIKSQRLPFLRSQNVIPEAHDYILSNLVILVSKSFFNSEMLIKILYMRDRIWDIWGVCLTGDHCPGVVTSWPTKDWKSVPDVFPVDVCSQLLLSVTVTVPSMSHGVTVDHWSKTHSSYLMTHPFIHGGGTAFCVISLYFPS